MMAFVGADRRDLAEAGLVAQRGHAIHGEDSDRSRYGVLGAALSAAAVGTQEHILPAATQAPVPEVSGFGRDGQFRRARAQ
jgi:hypothetical protein